MINQENVPHEKGLDNSLDILLEGYPYMSNRFRAARSTIFTTRLLGGKKVICISGEEAASIFYDTDRFVRRSAIPKRIQKSLFGQNGVQMLDGAEHQHRKQLFMACMTPERLKVLTDITKDQWHLALHKWERVDTVILFDEMERLLCRVACKWAGVPLWAKELDQRATDLGMLVDAFGAVGVRHWRGRNARNRLEKWIQTIIKDVRTRNIDVKEDTPLYMITSHRDLSGKLLPTHVASVEVINILRPIVAIARYITFGVLALHEYTNVRENLENDPEAYSQPFVQEVRRFYPFTPFLGARVRKDFTWQGYRFKKGRLVLLDIYGANHTPALWNHPEQFNPDRFNDWVGSPFQFIPQGGGEYDMGHRCAGEWVTIEVMKTSLTFLTHQMAYDVPPQDLRFSLVRMPSLPKSRMVIRNVRKKT